MAYVRFLVLLLSSWWVFLPSCTLKCCCCPPYKDPSMLPRSFQVLLRSSILLQSGAMGSYWVFGSRLLDCEHYYNLIPHGGTHKHTFHIVLFPASGLLQLGQAWRNCMRHKDISEQAS